MAFFRISFQCPDTERIFQQECEAIDAEQAERYHSITWPRDKIISVVPFDRHKEREG